MPDEPQIQCSLVEPGDVERYESSAVDRLKQQGLRVTKPRKSVLRTLASTRRPLGAYQIRDRVHEAGERIDVVSVYRILASLVEAGLAHHIGSVDGYLACWSKHTGVHQTQHLICDKCGCVEEMPIPSSALSEIGVASSRFGFLTQLTRVEVTGVCSHCR